MMADLQDHAIRQHCKALRMPTIGTQFSRLADAASREGQSHLGYLEALLAAEMEERESRAITRLLHEAKLPRMKTLDGFEFDRSGVSAAHANQLSRALARWERLDLICIDELGYVPLAETACELMFQVIADRAEKAAVIVTTNLPFPEWSQVIPNPPLCKALIDRLTDQAHIITTGADSYRFRRTSAQRKPAKS